MKFGILIPHIFAQQSLLNKVIFAPVHLAVDLADNLSEDHEVYLFSPGKLDTKAQNINVDLTPVENEVAREGCSLPQLINQNPLSFVSLSRQIQSELTAKAFEFANSEKLDILHVFMCESEIPLYFADLVNVPVVFTHHDPYNFYRKYRVRFPKLKNLNYVSISDDQRKSAPQNLNFVATVYNGLDLSEFEFNDGLVKGKFDEYFAFIGRIIRVKGCHTAIQACLETNNKLRVAGKYYESDTNSENEDGGYWSKYIKPNIDNENIIYDGFIGDVESRSKFLGDAKALLFPIEWSEPFGLVMIESMACGTPVIAFNKGPVREIVKDGVTGFVVNNLKEMEDAMDKIESIDRSKCRNWVESNFTVEKMSQAYLNVYRNLITSEE